MCWIWTTWARLSERCVSVWSVNHFDGVYVARAGVCFGGASATGGALALLGGTRIFSSCGLTDGELKEWETKESFNIICQPGGHVIKHRQQFLEVPYLCNRMMALNYHRAHGRSHAQHLEVAACCLPHIRASCDASRYSLCGFLLTGCDGPTTDLKQLALVYNCDVVDIFLWWYNSYYSYT